MHKRILILASILSLMCARIDAQISLEGYNAETINPVLLTPGEWPASWISTAEEIPGYGVCHFRRTFILAAKPESFVVNLSADARYKLYVNGAAVCYGPAKGNDKNWNFDTVDIAPYLQAGENLVSALVWNQGSSAAIAQMSHGKLAFLLQGNSDAEQLVNTDENWLVLRDEAFSPVEVEINGYYAAGACDRVEDKSYPWGWQNLEYDDSRWEHASAIRHGAIKGTADYPEWQLVPRPIPQMEHTPFVVMEESVSIDAQSEKEFILDNRELVTGYPVVRYSGGKGATVEIGYAESLYEGEASTIKGNRNDTGGKCFQGYHDEILPDGGQERTFEPLWWRTWRFLRVKVKTGDEPLVIHGIDGITSMYPMASDSQFKASGSSEVNIDRIVEVGWRTARLCAHETFQNSPYYEQLQYFGDARVQALATMFNSRDALLVKNLLEQGRQSMISDGITMSRFPSTSHQFIPTYSLLWICTAHDYWLYRGDEKYLKTLLPAFRSVLSWFESYLGDDNCLHDIPYWSFADDCGVERGVFPTDELGRSAFIDQIFIMALQFAADMESSFGNPGIGKAWRSVADRMIFTFNGWYWDSRKGMYACNSARDSFSQHVNALAIITGTVQGSQAAELCDRILKDSDIYQCTLYFRLYLLQAMKVCGKAENYLDHMDLWENQLELGLTTWAEEAEDPRSDCHAAGISPNVELFRTVAGIEATAPGFSKVIIEPALGPLTRLEASIPHPNGKLAVKYVLRKKHLTAEVSLPKDVTGVFKWRGKELQLRSGKNKVMISRQ